MGRTNLAITPQLEREMHGFTKFRRALRRADQLVLDELFEAARLHLAAVAYAAHPLPIATLLLSMQLENHKRDLAQDGEITRLSQEIERLRLEIEAMRLVNG